jgi:protein-L-isoaspartate(D-aspartate) O-methyltransferase
MVRSLFIVLVLMGVLLPGLRPVRAEETDMDRQRQQMVDRQLRARGIKDARVLRAMQTVPRHRFVPESLSAMAYADTPLPIGHGQTISQPYIVALMSEVLAVKPGQRILEIGTGSGYQAAILAELEAVVFTIEIVRPLANQAKTNLQTTGYDSVRIRIGDGYLGWPEAAPFDAIIVTCAPEKIPQPLQDQLTEGGRMVIPVGEKNHQQLMLLTKQKGKIQAQKVVDVRFVPMVDGRGKRY